MVRLIVLLTSLLAVCSAPAMAATEAPEGQAGSVADSTARLRRVIAGDKIIVTTKDGAERVGKLRSLLFETEPADGPPRVSAIMLTMSDRVERVPLSNVFRVEQSSNRVMRGGAVGAGIGGAVMLLLGGPGCLDDNQCNAAGPALFGAGMGFLIGVWASAGRKGKRDLIYFSGPVAEGEPAAPALVVPEVTPPAPSAVPPSPPVERPAEPRPNGAVASGSRPASFDELAGVLRIGDRVSVIDMSGHTYTSTVSRLSSTSIALAGPDVPREFTVGDVAAVSRRQEDSVWNGTLIGLACGLGPSLVLYSGGTPPQRVGAATFWGGIGALIGFGIDKGIPGREVVIFGDRPNTTSHVTLAPVVLPGRFAIAGRISY